MSEKIVTGPIQVFVIGFDKFEASGQIMAELRRVRKRGVIRLVDLLFVEKDWQGNVSSSMHMTDLSEAERERLGALAGGIIGLEVAGLTGAARGAELGALNVAERDYGLSQDQLRELAGSIPNGTAAAIMVIEHHWATRLREALVEADGTLLAQAMVGPNLLVSVGAELYAAIEAEQALEAAEAIKAAAATEAALALAELQLVEEAAINEAADVVSAALAVEEAAEEEAAEALIAAKLIKEAAAAEAADVIADAMAIEEEAYDEAAEAVAEAEEIKKAAALAAVRALMAAELIKEEAAQEAAEALVAAKIIEEAAVEEAAEVLKTAGKGE